jgi:hypothetical protein
LPLEKLLHQFLKTEERQLPAERSAVDFNFKFQMPINHTFENCTVKV